MLLIAALSVLSQLHKDLDRSMVLLDEHHTFVLQVNHYLSGLGVQDRWDYRLEQRSPSWACIELQNDDASVAGEDYTNSPRRLIYELKGRRMRGYDLNRNEFSEEEVTPQGNALTQIISLTIFFSIDPRVTAPALFKKKGWRKKKAGTTTFYQHGDERYGDYLWFDPKSGNRTTLRTTEGNDVFIKSFSYTPIGPEPIFAIPKAAIKVSSLNTGRYEGNQ